MDSLLEWKEKRNLAKNWYNCYTLFKEKLSH